MKDIFLSYKKEDADRVRLLVEALEREGYTVWWDRTIPPGSSWAEVIEDAIRSCRVVVVVWSKLSVESEWVSKEARKGEMRGNLVPVVIDADAEIPFEFEHKQGVSLVGWDGVSPNEQFEQVKAQISKLIETKRRSRTLSEIREERLNIRESSKRRLTVNRAFAGVALLASAIAVPELLHTGNSIIAQTYRPLEVYTAIALIFLVTVLPLNVLLRRLQKVERLGGTRRL